MVDVAEGTGAGVKHYKPAVYLLALLGGLVAHALLPGDPSQKAVMAVFVVTVILWVSEALPLAVTAVGAALFLVLTGATDAKTAFASLGDPVIFLFIGSFMLARAMETTGLAKRAAFWLIRQKWATGSLRGLLMAIALVACLLSLFISNTATTAMLLPIVKTVLDGLGKLKRDGPESSALLLMTTWAAGIAVGTMVATPPNMIGVSILREQGGVDLNFTQFAMFGMPVTVVLILLAWWLLGRGITLTPEDLAKVRESALATTKDMGRWSAAERNTMLAFGVAIFLWVVPGVMESFLSQEHDVMKWVKARFPESVAALVGAGLLFLLPAKGTKSGMTFTWDEAKEIDWGTVLLFAGGIALGSAVFASGLAQMMGEALAGLTGQGNVWLVTFICMVAAVLLSELASNTASATVIVPISIALAQGAGVNPAAPTIGAILACSLGFMFPVSTPPNALVFGTGYVSGRQMMKKGVVFDVVAVLATLFVLWLVLPRMGLV